MALQGTLDTFALPDVLRLLATTRKTGRLRVNGDRGSGSLWVEEGQLAASELIVPGATDDSLINTLFHLLRFKRGSFIFETGAMAPAGMVASEIEPMLDEAEAMLVEWRSIEAVVPSVDAWLTLRPELAGSMVKIDNERWRIIAAIGGGRSVGGVGEALGLDELPALRGVKEIVELGLVTVGTRAPDDAEGDRSASLVDEALSSSVADAVPPIGEPADLRTQWEGPGDTNGQSTTQPGFQGWDEPTSEWEESAPGYYQPHDMAGPSSSEMSGLGDAGLSDEPHYDADSYPEPARGRSFESELDDPAEIARQLANLSPRAAKAVAAAAKAQTPEEREAALAAIEAEDDTVNRGLLLKFLGSVDS
ncbi:MAG TPA: DUF4388 domain-containing protein [Acidimicrobiales bacterium]|nr:DUF4388 domain-containing protein [Acidimicrobiales bacterium]